MLFPPLALGVMVSFLYLSELSFLIKSYSLIIVSKSSIKFGNNLKNSPHIPESDTK